MSPSTPIEPAGPEVQPETAEFDAFAAGYDAGMDDPLKRLAGQNADVFIELKVEWLLDHLRRRPLRLPGGRSPGLLDFGCGAGLFLRILRRMGFEGRLHGCDISRGMLDEADERWREGPAPNFASYDGKRLPYDDGSMDVVIACAVFHHIPPELREHAYAEIARVLCPGGRFYVFEHNPWNPVTRWVVSRAPIDADASLLSHGDVRRGVEASGFRHAGTEHLMFFPPRWRWVRRLERGLRRLPLGGQYVSWAHPDR